MLGGKHYTVPNVTVTVIARDREKYTSLADDLFHLLDDLFQKGAAAVFVICMTVQNSKDFKLAADTRYPGKNSVSYNRETSDADKKKECFGSCWKNVNCRKCSLHGHDTKNCVLSERNKLRELFGASAGVCYTCFCKDKYSNCGRECQIKDRVKYLLARQVEIKDKRNDRGHAFEEELKRYHKSDENWLLRMALLKERVWKAHKLT